MSIEVVSPFELASVDLRTWARLQASHPDLASPFLSPGWSMALAKLDGPDRRFGRVAVVVEGGEGRGFFAARASRFTALPAGALMSDYQGLVAEPDVQLDARELVRALGVQRLDLLNVPQSQTTFAPHLRVACDSRLIDLTGGFDTYAAARKAAGSSILADTAKKRRKLEKDHGAIRFTAQSASIEDLAVLMGWKSAQWRETNQPDVFQTPWTAELVRRLHAHPEPGCAGELFTLHVGDRLAAAHFALAGSEVLHAWFIAHDDHFARYSPGVVLIVDILKWAGERGLREMDLGPGDYRFKLQLANAGRAIGHGYVGRPSAATFVRAAQFGVRQAAEALPLGRYSDLPAKAMRRIDNWRGLR